LIPRPSFPPQWAHFCFINASWMQSSIRRGGTILLTAGNHDSWGAGKKLLSRPSSSPHARRAEHEPAKGSLWVPDQGGFAACSAVRAQARRQSGLRCADGVGHNRTASTERLLRSYRGVARGLMLDLGSGSQQRRDKIVEPRTRHDRPSRLPYSSKASLKMRLRTLRSAIDPRLDQYSELPCVPGAGSRPSPGCHAPLRIHAPPLRRGTEGTQPESGA
jgi:hypothetical protein